VTQAPKSQALTLGFFMPPRLLPTLLPTVCVIQFSPLNVVLFLGQDGFNDALNDRAFIVELDGCDHEMFLFVLWLNSCPFTIQ
jgi:hypothetical protein